MTSVSDEIGEEIESVEVALEMMVTFRLGRETYAIPMAFVKEAMPFQELTPLPQVKAAVSGLSNVRGEVYVVLDVSVILDENITQDQNQRYLLVINHEEYRVALLIADIPQALKVPEDAIDRSSEVVQQSRKNRSYVEGTIKHDNKLMILLDTEDLINSEKVVS